MRSKQITAYTDLRGRKVSDVRAVGDKDSKIAPQLPALEEPQVQNISGSITTSPAQDAALQRAAVISKIPDLSIETEAQRIENLHYIHPDKLPCGYLQTKIIDENTNTNAPQNFVVIITGPFGGGKDEVARVLLADGSLNTTKAILCTSRPMGNREVPGKDYYFVLREEFIQMRDNNEFLSWNDLEAGFYGVLLKSTKELLKSKKEVVATVGPTVAKPLKKGLDFAKIPYVEIFLIPISKDELEKPGGIDKALNILRGRLTERNRGKTDITYRELLLERSRIWLSELDRFQYVVENLNGKSDNAAANVINLIKSKQEEIRLSNLAKESPQLKFEATGELPDIKLNPEKFILNKNIAIILTGPSGSGKDALLSHIRQDGFLDIIEPLSHTTRPIRENEQPGKNNFYVSQEEFEKIIVEKKFAEWVMVHNGYFFGKEVTHIQESLDGGKDLVLALNVSGANYYKHLFTRLGVPCIDIFLSPGPKELLDDSKGIEELITILEERLRNRKSGETEAQIQDRLNVAREWLKGAKTYSHIVENPNGGLEKAIRDFVGIVRAKKIVAYAKLGFWSDVCAPFATVENEK